MQRKNEANGLRRVWVERIAWNVAAGATLMTMIAILLYSLQWLDEIDREARRDRAGPELELESERQPARIARADRPRG